MKKFILLAFLTSCGPSPEILQLVRDEAAVSDADYRSWDLLSPAQQKEHALDHARSTAALNFALNAAPVPTLYVVTTTEVPK